MRTAASVRRQNVTENVPLVTDLVPDAPVPATGIIVKEKVPVAPVALMDVIVNVPDPPDVLAAQDWPVDPDVATMLAFVGLVGPTDVVPTAASAPKPSAIVPGPFEAAAAKMPL